MTYPAIAARNEARREDLTWLADTGESLTGAAQRLGMRPGSLETWCRRHAPDLLQRLLAREPIDPNARTGRNLA